MNSVALNEAKSWTEILLDAEYRGRKDREGPVRYRLSKRLGIPESYLFRLQYKSETMKDVRGSVYRTLMLANQKYEAACRRIENVADRMEAERQEIEETDATYQGASPNLAGVERAARGAAQ